MDSKSFKEKTRLLKEVNAVIGKLDPAIRGEAFSILKSYITGHAPTSASVPDAEQHSGEGAGLDKEAFFTKYGGDKPNENAVLAAAYLYSQYGTEPFKIDEIRQLAKETGITISDRLDMTFEAKRAGKALFQRVGQGMRKPTVHGEAFFKSSFKVKRGTKKRLASA